MKRLAEAASMLLEPFGKQAQFAYATFVGSQRRNCTVGVEIAQLGVEMNHLGSKFAKTSWVGGGRNGKGEMRGAKFGSKFGVPDGVEFWVNSWGRNSGRNSTQSVSVGVEIRPQLIMTQKGEIASPCQSTDCEHSGDTDRGHKAEQS